MNEPTRPGCEVCSAERPADYQVPTEVQRTEDKEFRTQTEPHVEENRVNSLIYSSMSCS